MVKKFNSEGKFLLLEYTLPIYTNIVFYQKVASYFLSQFCAFKLINFSIFRTFFNFLLFSLFHLSNCFSSLPRKAYTTMFSKLLLNFFVKGWSAYASRFSNTFNVSKRNLYLNSMYMPIGIENLLLNSRFFLNKQGSFYVLYIKVSLNNVFVTLAKNGSDVIATFSGGQTSSKKKKDPLTVFFLVSRIVQVLKKFNISTIDFLIVRSKWFKLGNVALAPLKRHRIKVNYVGFDFLKSHNGLRKKKIRRL